jgi:glycosyltransferase involved in cell wall biosynthesis
MMRVAQMIDNLEWGGAQKMLVQLSGKLSERGIQVTLVSLYPPDGSPFRQQILDAGLRVETFAGAGLFDLARLSRLEGWLRAEKFDLLQTYLTYANILGALAGRLAGIPVVASLRSAGLDPQHYHPLRYNLESWLLRHAAERVLVNGYSIAEAHRPRLGGTPIDVIPNAISLPGRLTAQERAQVRQEWMGTDSLHRPVLISVGRLVAPKGYSDLIQAFETVTHSFPQACLWIVGGGDLLPDLQAQVHSLGLEEHVRLTGPRQDVPRLLAAADVYVNASHWEGMSVAILEALAAGLPVIATRVGDAGRIITPLTGRLVPPQRPDLLAEAMLELLRQPQRWDEMGAAGRELVGREYNLEKWTDCFVDLYRGLANGGHRAVVPGGLQ